MDVEIRKETENIEERTLSEWATLSKNCKKRKNLEEECPIRTSFQRDRDRIIHSKSFRRLKHKTQVFICPEGDHYRTRLTHTLEVSSISRTVARALRLNEDLTEAIAMAHDLGHTPFGHAGEDILNNICPGGFKHYDQSVRVCEVLENEGKGLNLTEEVLDGVLNHTKGPLPKTLEGQIVRICDKIAYINHDIDDALRAGVIKMSDIPADFVENTGTTCSERINAMVISLVKNTEKSRIKMESEVEKAFFKMHKFMYEKVYLSEIAKTEEKKAVYIVEWLYKYFKENNQKLPGDIIEICQKEGLERGVCDYIAGMTDDFAIKLFKDLFIPKPWKGIQGLGR